MKIKLFILVAFTLTAFTLKKVLFEIPQNFPKPYYDFSQNELNEATIFLGRNLFYEPMLSKNNSVSCESCHSPFSAFTHIDHPLSHGIYDSIGKRNAPALMNLAWQRTFMWDGAIHNIEVQSLAPISHPKEMGSSIQEVLGKLTASAKYRSLFYQAYGDSFPTGEKTLKALSQFMLTLVSANSKYDKVKRGELEFSEFERKGYALFQKHCNMCHTEPLFTNLQFVNNGLKPDSRLKDWGRMGISQKSGDSLKFKVPTLRNIEFSYPYMHDGRFMKISEVLTHYSMGIHHSETLAPELKSGIPISDNDKVDLTHFLLALSDKEFVFNPQFRFPK